MDKLKVGVIGVGHLGRHHARIYSELEDCDLYGVVDIDPKQRDEIAEAYNTKAFADYRELIGHVDAVSVAVPTILHYQISKDLVGQGIDLLVEKPMTSTLAQAWELLDLSHQHKVILQIGHLERFNSAVLTLEKYVNNPRYIESNRISPFIERGVDVDVVLDLMIHDIDIILSIVKSKIKKIEAVGVPVISPKIDIANARLEFESGCVATLTASRVHQGKVRKLRIFEPTSYYSIDYIDQETKVFPLNGRQMDVKTLKIKKEEPLKKELQNFFKCVKDGKTRKVTGDEGLRALKLAYRVLEETEM